MNSKKLARLFYAHIGVVVLIALFLLYYQQQQKKKTQHVSDANVVSRVDTITSDDDIIEPSQQVINVETILSDNIEVIAVSDSTEDLSYMAVYKDLQSARACRSFYRFWREQGLAADFNMRVGRPHYFYGQQVYAGDELVPLTAAQNETLSHWVQRCYQMWLDYGEFERDDEFTVPLNDVTDAISKKLLSITPKTKEEQQLKNIRLMASQWTASFKALEGAYEGEDSLSVAELEIIQNEVILLSGLREELRLRWLDVRDNNQDEADSLSRQRQDLSQQIRVLRAKIKNQKVPNDEKIMQAQAVFQNMDQAMSDALKTNFADVFFEIIYAFRREQAFMFQFLGFEYSPTFNQLQPAHQHRITPDQLVYAAAGLETAPMHQWELRYATHLYLCELGWDCGPQSPIVMNYCLFGLSGSYPDACGQGLPNFYQQHFISPNRWGDVLRFKSLFKELFYE